MNIRNQLKVLTFLFCSLSYMMGGSVLAQSDVSKGELATLSDIVVTGEAAKLALEKNLLRFDVAERIAKACFDHARDNNFKVSLHIIDQFGYVIFAGRMDGQQADNVETSGMKAKTALYFREPTRVWMERSMNHSQMGQWLSQMEQFPVVGGLPIIVEDQVVGAIGVGGGSSNQDEECARAGLIAVLGPQPTLTESP
jgi:glc operon protein GlcG